MEAFSLLKYWRGGGGGGGGNTSYGDAGFSSPSTASSTAGTTTILTTTVSPHFTDSDSDSESDTEDDGPFFDLEFTTATEDEDGEAKPQTKAGENEDKYVDVQLSETDGGSGSDDDNEGELNLAFSPASSVDRADANASPSQPDGLFLKGRFVPVEPSLTANSKFPVSLLKSATKFRVLMLKLKKPKANSRQNHEKPEQDSKPCPKRKARSDKGDAKPRAEKKFLTVKLKVDEAKIKSLFTRDSSNSKAELKPNADESHSNSSSTSEDRKFSKEIIQKYFKKVKPLYIRVPKRYGDKLAGSVAAASPSPPQSTAEKLETEPTEPSEKAAVLSNAKSQKQGNLPAVLRVVPKTLVKSRSASSATAATAPVSSQRRDDSLKEQNDGIQGAILHCKRSFNS